MTFIFAQVIEAFAAPVSVDEVQKKSGLYCGTCGDHRHDEGTQCETAAGSVAAREPRYSFQYTMKTFKARLPPQMRPGSPEHCMSQVEVPYWS